MFAATRARGIYLDYAAINRWVCSPNPSLDCHAHHPSTLPHNILPLSYKGIGGKTGVRNAVSFTAPSLAYRPVSYLTWPFSPARPAHALREVRWEMGHRMRLHPSAEGWYFSVILRIRRGAPTRAGVTMYSTRAFKALIWRGAGFTCGSAVKRHRQPRDQRPPRARPCM